VTLKYAIKEKKHGYKKNINFRKGHGRGFIKIKKEIEQIIKKVD
jgi:hypothetical protein